MKVGVSHRVHQTVTDAFPSNLVATVCDELATADFPLINNNGERVQLAVLRLAQGDLGAFRKHLLVAKTDWRDVLAVTGL